MGDQLCEPHSPDVDRTGVHAAFKMFEAARKERTAQIQLVSHQNIWLHRSGDTDWVFGYDAWKAPIGDTRVASAG